MAAPFVSGVAALVWSQKGATTGADVKNIILSKVRHVKVLEGKTTTGGALDAKNALSP
jgi:subtilisin family serine protease